MACNVAAYVDGDGETGYVSGGMFDVYGEAGLGSAESLRSYAEAVDLFKHFGF